MVYTLRPVLSCLTMLGYLGQLLANILQGQIPECCLAGEFASTKKKKKTVSGSGSRPLN